MNYMNNKADEYFKQFRQIDFPVYSLSDAQMLDQYQKLCRHEVNNYRDNSAINIIMSAHPSIWRCNILGRKAPCDAWYDDELLYKTIENRLKYKGENLTPIDIVHGFSISKIAPKISLFRPATAKCLIKRYLDNFNTIFDPCAGFSGRMLGACSLNKKYIGYDINSVTVKESDQLKNLLKLEAKIYCKDSLYIKEEHECLFTCPPYGNKETWHQDIEILSADEWIDICLNNFKCEKYLFVVDKTAKYNNYVVDIISNKSHFANKSELVILI